MARGRHAKPSGLLARLFPGRAARRRAAQQQQTLLVRQLHDEVLRLRSVGTGLATEAVSAAARASRAEQQAASARTELAELRAETAALREEMTRLREELVWAFAEGRVAAPQAAPDRMPARVIDLREHAG